MSDHVLYEASEGVATITLNRPEQANAQDEHLIEDLDAAWTRAAKDDAVGVIVLRANGKHFSSGHDLKAKPARLLEPEQQGANGYRLETGFWWELEHYLGYSRRWRDIPKASIAAVQGACIAGGLLLAWPCDLIVCADDAYFSDPVVRFGIGGVEYHGHTWELGARKAKELLFTAEAIGAVDAQALGMVNRVVPRSELDAEVRALALKIAGMPRFGVAQAKRSVNQTLDIMGQYNALQACFDAHWAAHGNAISITGGRALLSDLEGIRSANRESGMGSEDAAS